MRQHRCAEEKMFVDYAGSTVALSDGARAQVFVSAMAASICVFACATPVQRHANLDRGLLAQRASVYEAAKKAMPERWRGRAVRNWALIAGYGSTQTGRSNRTTNSGSKRLEKVDNYLDKHRYGEFRKKRAHSA
ncbi:hypothetical protein J8G26_16660 [Acidovorax sp. JG5]|uniref:hypothetical protein n=1 Tax=Acidovorax sp. JG5 TaxID=2822718 RepID=UPI001B320C09|nr:hypothetical protein [Acidovorax sp. JG5]MBP3982342.1 hypothetical protein [Acidovorax sp. JG5]